MTLNFLLPAWLMRKFIRAGPAVATRPALKQRQLLPTLPLKRATNVSFQDDNSPAGYRLQWRQ